MLNPSGRTVTELEVEVTCLRKKLAETRLEKEVLKKAMAYLNQVDCQTEISRANFAKIQTSF